MATFQERFKGKTSNMPKEGFNAILNDVQKPVPKETVDYYPSAMEKQDHREMRGDDPYLKQQPYTEGENKYSAQKPKQQSHYQPTILQNNKQLNHNPVPQQNSYRNNYQNSHMQNNDQQSYQSKPIQKDYNYNQNTANNYQNPQSYPQENIYQPYGNQNNYSNNYYKNNLLNSNNHNNANFQSNYNPQNENNFTQPNQNQKINNTSQPHSDQLQNKKGLTEVATYQPFPQQQVVTMNSRSYSAKEKAQSGSQKYRPYTLREYEEMKKTANAKMGGLGPNTYSEEWVKEREKAQKRQEFADQVKQFNQENLTTQTSLYKREKDEKKVSTTRQRANEFAKNIPKPIPKNRAMPPQIPVNIPLQQSENDIEKFERQHLQYLEQLDKIKNDDY